MKIGHPKIASDGLYEILKRDYLLRRAGAAGAHEGRDLGADDRVIFGLGVLFEPIHIFFGYRHVGKDGFDGAFGQTCVTVDAVVRIDQKPVRRLVKSLDGTDGGAIGVLTIDARRCSDIGHLLLKFSSFSST